MTQQISGGSGAAVGQQPLKQQLSYALASDISALALTSGAWVDVIANQSFSLDGSSSITMFSVLASLFTTNSVSTHQDALRLVVDSGGTPTIIPLGGVYGVTLGANYELLCNGVRCVASLALGSHTVKVQAYTSIASTVLYCRPVTGVNVEFLTVQVMEYKALL